MGRLVVVVDVVGVLRRVAVRLCPRADHGVPGACSHNDKVVRPRKTSLIVEDYSDDEFDDTVDQKEDHQEERLTLLLFKKDCEKDKTYHHPRDEVDAGKAEEPASSFFVGEVGTTVSHDTP